LAIFAHDKELPLDDFKIINDCITREDLYSREELPVIIENENNFFSADVVFFKQN
jgi:hypothetical protein